MIDKSRKIFWYWPIPLVFFLYHLFNVNYAALTYPFWDHVEIGRIVVKSFDGTLTWSDLWAPHNHSRPLLLRLIFVANAHLTAWDIRSEFTLSLLTVALQLISLLIVVSKFAQQSLLRYPGLLLAFFSALICSPAAHNNHWWSFMLQLQGASLLSIWAIAAFSFAGTSIAMQLLSIVLAWASALFISNGIFLHVVCVAAAMMLAGAGLRGLLVRGLWVISLIILLATYIPGVESSSRGGAPRVLDMLKFISLYIGMPVGQLLWFQFEDMFAPPKELLPNLAVGIAGSIVLGMVLLALWARTNGGVVSRVQSMLASPLSRFAAICIGYSLLSAAGTGWGRITFDDVGIFNANASRYAVFSLYFWIGLALFVSSIGPPRQLIAVAAVIFFPLTVRSYYVGEKIYTAAHNFNIALSEAYSCPVGGEQLAGRVFPNTSLVPYFKWSLLENELAPYDYHFPADRTPLRTVGKFVDTTALSDSPVELRISPHKDRLVGLKLQVVTFGDTSAAYPCTWKLFPAAQDKSGNPLRSGTFNTSKLSDWGFLRMYFEPVDSMNNDLILSLSCQVGPNTEQLAALPIFEPGVPTTDTAPTIKGSWNVILEFLPC
jgi:hypothetical protein